eukprot:s5636_g2.t1
MNLTQPQSNGNDFTRSAQYFRDAVQRWTTPMVEEGRWEDKERFLEEVFSEFRGICADFRQHLQEDANPMDEVEGCCSEMVYASVF